MKTSRGSFEADIVPPFPLFYAFTLSDSVKHQPASRINWIRPNETDFWVDK